MRLPDAKTVLAMLISSIVGMIAGLITLHIMGEPTPLS